MVMDPLVTSTLISSGASLLGGLFGKKKEQQIDPLAQQQAMDINRPSWVVEGAKKAGIHPLVALGMSPVGAVAGSFGTEPDNRVGDAVNTLGQGVSRAAEAWASKEERAMGKASAALQLENMQLQNDRLRSEIRLANSVGSPPGLAATPFMAGSGDIKNVPEEFYGSLPTPLGTSKAAPLYKTGITPDGVPVRVWDENTMGDNELLAAMSAIGVTIPDLIHGYIGRPAGKALRKIMTSRHPESYGAFRK